MAFKLEDVTDDLAADLAKAAENLKDQKLRVLLNQAATKLDDYQRFVEDVATELDSAAALKVGMMDSQSRADEVARCIRGTLIGLSARAKELLTRPVTLPPPPMSDSAVI